MEITIRNRQRKVILNPVQIIQSTARILAHKGISSGFLSLVIVTDSRIQSLNKKFLKRNHPTDVLAFDLRDDGLCIRKKGEKRNSRSLEGEIIVSATTACRNARLYKNSLQKEVMLYVVHGILHLLGYDDHAPCGIKRMRREEKRMMNFLGDV